VIVGANPALIESPAVPIHIHHGDRSAPEHEPSLLVVRQQLIAIRQALGW